MDKLSNSKKRKSICYLLSISMLFVILGVFILLIDRFLINRDMVHILRPVGTFTAFGIHPIVLIWMKEKKNLDITHKEIIITTILSLLVTSIAYAIIYY